ncbi:hypothetical protein SAMN04487895_101496 [Paenibacillus sophorae]|uniref:Uncharacterized protein n=1 Tax=Paenibacillus sophorae TaxID=1333845 RepID=A0A1H8GFH0_9BACL|nr:hypothetical protein [Paenibacillus sophorae]QWU14207.1 hypothetical protein KP014_20050 [Paenibacillus sophorae]SEN42742.1 hypothetical protein SAMN04487895_101496 [Paenibacillus sophorae]
MTGIFKENALYRYHNGIGHCKHGIVYTMKDILGNVWAIDTYWDSKFSKRFLQNATVYYADRILNDLEFIMMIDEAVEVSANEYYLYDSKDALYIPVGGRHERYLVNKNAKKNTDSVIDYIEDKISKNETMIKNLASDNRMLNEWLCVVNNDPDVAQLYKNEKYEYTVENAILFALKRGVK